AHLRRILLPDDFVGFPMRPRSPASRACCSLPTRRPPAWNLPAAPSVLIGRNAVEQGASEPHDTPAHSRQPRAPALVAQTSGRRARTRTDRPPRAPGLPPAPSPPSPGGLAASSPPVGVPPVVPAAGAGATGAGGAAAQAAVAPAPAARDAISAAQPQSSDAGA